MTAWLEAGRTAVITGGASGIGLAAARRYLERGMNVVIADRDQGALEEASARLQDDLGAGEALATQLCDVAKPQDLERLRDLVTERFGPVHCLMNNAGVASRAGAPWENPEAMRALIDVNLWGVVQGCCAFIPSMLEHGQAAAVINTGSKQGITRPPGNIAYNISKAGVLAYTEAIAHALRGVDGCNISAHLLIPGFVYTGMIQRFLPEQPPAAATPEETVDFMLDALARSEFYIICPDNETPRALDEKRIQWTADDLIKNRPALSRWHPDFAGAYDAFVKNKTE